MGKNALNVLGSGKLPVPPAVGQVNSVPTYHGAVSIWLDLPTRGLNTLAEGIGHEFHHHHAQADAEAAGRVLLAMMKHANATMPSELLQKAGIVPRRF
jgi:DNA polymerase III epsilon subunit-like protein